MQNNEMTVAYPRRNFRRRIVRLLGRLLLPLLSRTETRGFDNFPKHGPLLVVGNHIAAVEVILMVVYAPWQLEMLGPGDIPPRPFMDAFASFYGYTPINRGNMDRVALAKLLSVLKQGGVVGMFPEGGIWDTGEKPAKRGVAWLSYQAQAPILPIGFGGLEGALTNMLSFKRPKLAMNVGELIPPVALPPGVPRRDALQEASGHVMAEINRLIPAEFKSQLPAIVDERFELKLKVYNSDGKTVSVPDTVAIRHTDALCKLFYRPAILNVFARDLRLPVHAFVTRDPAPDAVARDIEPILHYLENENPAFFTYRFDGEGVEMEKSLRELRALALWAAEHNYTLDIQPIRRYRIVEESKEIVDIAPPQAHKW
ncbi:MAG: 1-acyl-sn-glycerol-3-phosphate acyltransferase [Anaerolineae bacterium]|nr:1-acyl-sn-glycerol-3-phosphate acyltransferase [Anaerolineae bacterium]